MPVEAEQIRRTPEVVGLRLMNAGFSDIEAANLVTNPYLSAVDVDFAAVLVEGGVGAREAMWAVWKGPIRLVWGDGA